jgi:hypothetical protein
MLHPRRLLLTMLQANVLGIVQQGRATPMEIAQHVHRSMLTVQLALACLLVPQAT